MDLGGNQHFIGSMVSWIQQYPSWSHAMVFAVALLESLVLVGVLVPGAALMLAAGALIALGALDLWPTLAWAAAGAVAGDGLSFWIGYRYRDRLLGLWPFSRYTRLLHRGEAFFARHGGKSVVFGRFVGPVRAVIPTVAGMMGMTPLRFAVVNILSALAWAPAYILPGMVFAASLEIASEVALRLVLSVVLLVTVLWLARWLIRRTFLWLAPKTNRLIQDTLDWSRRHPVLGRIGRALVDPRQPESPALLVLALTLLSAGMAFSYVLWQVLAQAGPPRLDTGVNGLMQSLRTPLIDHLMVAITMLGDAVVYVPVALTVLAWMLWRRNFAAAWHWLAAIGFGVLLSRTLKWSVAAPRPEDLYQGISAFAFPSGHTTVSTAMYGFLAVVAARELGPRSRLTVYMASGAMIVLIACSRLYLNAHWFSDVAGGFTLGLAWVAVLGIAYRRHHAPPLAATHLLVLSAGALLVFGGVHIAKQHGAEMQRYAPRVAITSLHGDDWWHEDWRALPPLRDDLISSHKQPLNVQWAGDLKTIRQGLEAAGWRAATPFSARNALQWLAPKVSIAHLPVMPQVHEGRHEQLRLVRAIDERHQFVLRLWAANAELVPDHTPLWIGTVSVQTVQVRFDLLRYAVTTTAFNRPLDALENDLMGWQHRRGQRELAPARTRVRWSGAVLLIRPDRPGPHE